MTTKQTSRQVFFALCKRGYIRGQQKRVLEAVLKYGPGTSREIIDRANRSTSCGLGTNINLIRARFTELHQRRLITTDPNQRKRCRITGHHVHEWRFNVDAPPIPPPVGVFSKLSAWRGLATVLLGELSKLETKPERVVELMRRYEELRRS